MRRASDQGKRQRMQKNDKSAGRLPVKKCSQRYRGDGQLSLYSGVSLSAKPTALLHFLLTVTTLVSPPSRSPTPKPLPSHPSYSSINVICASFLQHFAFFVAPRRISNIHCFLPAEAAGWEITALPSSVSRQAIKALPPAPVKTSNSPQTHREQKNRSFCGRQSMDKVNLPATCHYDYVNNYGSDRKERVIH
ncbi:hypothetical protein BaRGS_00000596 [Batillaria attramentaria]|uniref:Uncharacterized protein n=1 Tax=Batillaria attramentaria TaxID=370345 RepID=A0ABD0M9W5_9CAEN